MDVECPFCSFIDSDLQYVLEHIDYCHPDNDEGPHGNLASDNSLEEHPASHDDPTEIEYVQCECGEHVQNSEFTNHLALHVSEEMTTDLLPALSYASTASPDGTVATKPGMETGSQLRTTSNKRKTSKHTDNLEHSKVSRSNRSLFGRLVSPSSSDSRPSVAKSRYKAPRRLGTSELGPYAHEKQMPSWLRRQLETGAKSTVSNKLGNDGCIVRVESKANETRGTIPVLGRLCEQDDSVSQAYLCHSDVQHIVKMAREGGFCGYRNIQMIVSFIRNSESDGYQHFVRSIPSILELQDAIEIAWDKGINDFGRIETGGIKGTRKFIGTSEAQALFLCYEIGCEADAFGDSKGVSGYQQVLKAVEQYFLSGVTDKFANKKVHLTSLPPLYFQYPGHSVTIVGLEKLKNGLSNLLVFDPMFRPSPAMCLLIRSHSHPQADSEKLLKAYRRGGSSLSKYRRFELLKLTWRSPTEG